MNSKEALKNIKTLSYCKQHITIQEWCNIIEQDLEKLEKLEKIIEILKDKLDFQLYVRNDKFYVNYVWGTFSISQEEYKLLKEYL